MEYNLNDIIKMKICCDKCMTNRWKIIRMGADIRIKCLECGDSILMHRSKFENQFMRKYSMLEILQTSNDATETKEKKLQLYKETQIGDKVYLKDNYYCPNCNKNISCCRSSCNILRIEPSIILECNGCDRVLNLSYDEYIEYLSANRSLRNRNRIRRKKEVKEQLIIQKDMIEQDRIFQIQNFNKILQQDDIVMLNENLKCPQCGKQYYRIVDIPKLLNEPVTLICSSCRDIKKNKFSSDMHVLIETDSDDDLYYIKREPIYIKTITCPNCGNKNAKFTQVSFIPERFSITCENCKKSKSFKIHRKDFLKNIIETDEQKILEKRNETFKSLIQENDRVSTNEMFFYNISDVINKGNVTLELQLIDSAHNHVTAMHTIENKEINIAYKVGEIIKIFSYKCHYCVDCKKYFDFKSSFDIQLKKHHIEYNTLLINLRKNCSDIDSHVNIESFNSESLLHSMGYKVGHNGLSSEKRKKLLDNLLAQHFMTVSEIKATINNNIHRFLGRSEYYYAVSQWQEDIDYLNTKIKQEDSIF